jgi:hypothetical protein
MVKQLVTYLDILFPYLLMEPVLQLGHHIMMQVA